MIGRCMDCGALFETTTEDASAPDCRCVQCWRCQRDERERASLGLPTLRASRAMFAALDDARERRK